jgi:hypothetical protein
MKGKLESHKYRYAGLWSAEVLADYGSRMVETGARLDVREIEEASDFYLRIPKRDLPLLDGLVPTSLQEDFYMPALDPRIRFKTDEWEKLEEILPVLEVVNG